jgi:hypothetical protein
MAGELARTEPPVSSRMVPATVRLSWGDGVRLPLSATDSSTGPMAA